MNTKTTMMPFVDLARQQQRIKPALDAAIAKVLEHGIYIMGPEVRELESKLCEFTSSKHCITVSNGTDALIASLMAYDVGPGDAIITTPFTFFATVEAIMLLGATPVFADIEPDTFNISPVEIEKAIAKTQNETDLKLKGIMPVDLFGLPCNYVEINRIARENQLFVIQDAAQAFGATFDGKRCPTHADIGTTSFFPAKPFGCYGDGGAIFTDDDELAEKIRSIRVHGKGVDKYDNVRVGKNARLDTIQAAILLAKLEIYQDELNSRSNIARQYTDVFTSLYNLENSAKITLPTPDCETISAWAQYTIQLDNRDAVSAELRELGVPSLVYYRTPSHLLGACKHLGNHSGDFPIAEDASRRVLSLPFHPYLVGMQIDRVTGSLISSISV
jgi:UDP-2-acetamido-2-deoxy-ribo-hexuluronate aminotransferase